MAKEYDPSKSINGLYKLTGDTGSTRYMAPEVGLEKPYNEKVDVYSFGILFWQILSMEIPFSGTGFNVKTFKKLVFEKGARPVPDPKWPAPISALIRSCWSADISERPSMEEVVGILRADITINSEDEEVFDIMDASRKSEMSLKA